MDRGAGSPFASPTPGLRVREGAPPLRRPTGEEIAAFPERARDLWEGTWRSQEAFLGRGAYDLSWVEGRAFLLAGATGAGLGGALATALLHLLAAGGKLLVLGRDLKRSLGFETGLQMSRWAEERGMESRFRWLNGGMALDGPRLEEIVGAIRELDASRLVYVNTVAAASSGMLPGRPPVFVKDVDAEGLFEWKLLPLDERSVEATRFVMGTLAAEFPRALEREGVAVEATVFADWRGSLDRSSRDPDSPDYGRQGAYSTSLYLPKEILQAEASRAYGADRVVLDVFLPVMKTPALGMIPGGRAMSGLYDRLMEREGVRRVEIPELALALLERAGRAVRGLDDNPFPRLDQHEAPLDLHFLEVVTRLCADEGSDFHFRRWVAPAPAAT